MLSFFITLGLLWLAWVIICSLLMAKVKPFREFMESLFFVWNKELCINKISYNLVIKYMSCKYNVQDEHYNNSILRGRNHPD
jgi:hypothetical protein